MPSNSQHAKSGAAKVGADITGAAGGTFAILVSHSLPDNSAWKPILLYAAPTVTVSLSTRTSYLRERITRYLNEAALEAELHSASETIQQALNNQNTSDAHKEECRKNLEQVERLAIDTHLDRVRALATSHSNSIDKPKR
jgi:hypothetical protein